MPNFLSKWTDLILTRGLRVAGILILAFIVAQVLKRATNRLVEKIPEDSTSRAARLHEQQTRTLAGILNSAGVAAIFVIALIMILGEFGYNVAVLAGAAGLVSVCLAFGAQSLVRDAINGFFIVFEDQFVVGDTIKIGDVIGRVEHITLRRTVLRDPNGAIVTVLNGNIQQVSNLSRDWAQAFLNVIVAPGAPVDPALAALDSVAADFRKDAAWAGALVDGPRVLGVDEIGPLGAKLVVQVRTAPNRQDDVSRELRRRIWERFEQDGIRGSGTQRIELYYGEKQGGTANGKGNS
jgi:moderate conductance mechanosensitive channel